MPQIAVKPCSANRIAMSDWAICDKRVSCKAKMSLLTTESHDRIKLSMQRSDIGRKEPAIRSGIRCLSHAQAHIADKPKDNLANHPCANPSLRDEINGKRSEAAPF